MADTDCPSCRAESEDEEFTPGESVLTCIHCGFVGIWNEAGEAWRLLTPDEHAQLMGNEEFLNALSYGIAFRSWRDRDAVNLRAVLHSRLDREGVPGRAVDELCAEIMSAGYHTHPTEADIRALGLDTRGGAL